MQLKKIFTWLLVVVAGVNLTVCPAHGQSQKQTTIKGIVIGAVSNEPLEYATVAVYATNDSSLITGGITDTEGSFVIPVKATEIYIAVDFLGYKKYTSEVIVLSGAELELKKILLQPDNNLLSEVVVSAEKSQTSFRLDKRIFNVGKDLSSAGGSVFDILTNVPSVDVNLEGVVSLRGNSNVQILINGKPSVITNGNALGTISADMIEQVEVITNPSAKYDSEGTTGILNIVLKKEERQGVNGSVTLNTGVPNNHSIGLSINKRTDKFNFFSQLGVGKRTFESNFNGLTLDRAGSNNSLLRNEGEGEKNEQFYNLILGTDYHINKYNVITLTGHYGYEIEDEFSNTQFELENDQNEVFGSTVRGEVTEANNPKWQYELQFKKSYEGEKKRSLLASATGSFFGKDQSSVFRNFNATGPFEPFQQNVRDDFSNAQYNFQLDYVHPFSKKTTLESGAKYQISRNNNDYQVRDLAGDILVINPNFTNEFKYTQNVLAVYTTYAVEFDKISFKGGLRVEDTQLNTFLINTDESHNQSYINAFPSFHTSYKVNKELSFQVGYSRRIHRPDGWELNPFPSVRDNLNLSMGNPQLLPEYTNSYEATVIRDWNKASINGAVFHRKTTDVVDETFQVMDSLTISSPQNVGTSRNTGVELNGKVEPLRWLSVLADLNWMYFQRQGVFESSEFNFSNTNWTARLTVKFKIPKDISGEIRVRYRSAEERLQETIEDNAYIDLGVKKKFLKGKSVVNLSIRDLFSSRRFISRADQATFLRVSDRQWNRRQIVLGVSYAFGKGDAMEYGGFKQF